MRRLAQAVVNSDAPTLRELLLAHWLLDVLPEPVSSPQVADTDCKRCAFLRATAPKLPVEKNTCDNCRAKAGQEAHT